MKGEKNENFRTKNSGLLLMENIFGKKIYFPHSTHAQTEKIRLEYFTCDTDIWKRNEVIQAGNFEGVKRLFLWSF